MQLMNHKSSLESIIVIEKITEEARAKANELNIKLVSFEETKEFGKQNLKKPIVSVQN